MTANRRVGVLTTTRADAGPLESVIHALDAESGVDLVVVATGTHLDPRRGSLGAITVSDASVVEVFDAGFEQDDPRSMARASGRVAEGVSDVIARHHLDVLLVLGDRWELLAAAGAALIHGVPLAHLHGGEVTEGALDEQVRHAMTKLAHVHFAATDDAARRIRQLGEEEWRVHVTGAPGLDRLAARAEATAPDLDGVAEALGFALTRPFGLVTYHPETVDREAVGAKVAAVLDAAAAHLATAVVTAPGFDPGTGVVQAAIDEAVARHEHLHFVPNLGPRYPDVLATADVMLGNSSSGIIEAATFRLPVVDVGERQTGRLRPANVVHADDDRASIDTALIRALDPSFRDALGDLHNPYGDGRAAQRIVEVLRTISLDGLTRKRFVDSAVP